VTKRIHCALYLSLLVCAGFSTVARAAPNPAQHTTHNKSSNSRKAYLKQQKKQQKKMRKAEKRSQKNLQKRHKSAY